MTSPTLTDLSAHLRLSFEDVQVLQRNITNSKLENGTGSEAHAQAVKNAESAGPALVADYLLLRGEITQMERIVNAAIYLYDNRLGWGEGRNPYAPREFWDALGLALGRDPAGFCGAAEGVE